MKKTIAFLILLLIIVSVSFVNAEPIDLIPERVLEYAREVVTDEAKSFMKEYGYIGTVFESADEIDALRLGEGMAIRGLDRSNKKAFAWFVSEDEWRFSLDDETGPRVFFTVTIEDGRLCSSGAEDAKNFNDAKRIMKSLADAEGINDEPVFVETLTCRMFYLSFNGDERIITVPTSAYHLNDGYYCVTSYKELPTASEILAAIMQSEKDAMANPDAYGMGFVDLAPNINASDSINPELTGPDTNNSIEKIDKSKNVSVAPKTAINEGKDSHLLETVCIAAAIAAVAAALVIPAVFILIKRKKA